MCSGWKMKIKWVVEGEKRLVEWPRFSIPFDHKLLHHSHNMLARLWIFGTLNLQNDWTSPFEHNSQSAVFFSKNIFHELNRICSSCVMSVIFEGASRRIQEFVLRSLWYTSTLWKNHTSLVPFSLDHSSNILVIISNSSTAMWPETVPANSILSDEVDSV